MPVATATPQAAPVSMQGIAIPAAVVDKQGFFARTRRRVQQEKQISFTLGQSTRDVIELRKSDILSEVVLHITGNLTITPGTGTVASTAAWPYGLLRNVRFSANGVSSLISARGWTLRAREIAKDEGLSDRGVTNTVGGVSRSQGTLALACESWGVGQNTSTLGAQTNVPVDLVLTIPVAEDQFDLSGAIFLQTASASLTVELEWAQLSDLFTLTGNGAASFSGNVSVQTTKFEIPTANGAIIVPDLSMFHSLVETNTTALTTGVDNEAIVVGQGPGKYVLRVLYQHVNGSPSAPLAMTSANFGLQAWRYGTSETPDAWVDGSSLRIAQERAYNSDLGGLQGYGVHEFAKAGFRDLVDMGTTSDLRLVTNILNSVTLTNPKLYYAVESVYRSGQAA
jgi:hypothetical protein